MAVTQIAVLWFIGLCVILALASFFYLMRKVDQAIPPYRKATSRVHSPDGVGEVIELECGHAIKLIHHHRAEFPCEECKELAEGK